MSKKESTPKNKVTPNIQTENSSIGPNTAGYKLLWMIRQKLAENEMTLVNLSDETGISRTTLSHIMTGRRHATGLERESIIAIAKWLKIPTLAAMLLAEQITPTDFYDESLTKAAIARSVRYILSDPDWGSYAPPEILDNTNPQLQMYLIWCYEQATKTKLLSGSVDFLSLIQSMDKFRNEHQLETAKP